jgi:hypothetical protein
MCPWSPCRGRDTDEMSGRAHAASAHADEWTRPSGCDEGT